MIKHLLTTLYALAPVTTRSIPALAVKADIGEGARYYPISVEGYTYGEQNEPRISKVYQPSLSDNPSGVPRSDSVRNGRLCYLLDMTREDKVGVDARPHTETVTRPSGTDNMEEILQGLEVKLEVTTEEGHIGMLRLNHTNVQVTTNGYAIKTRDLSATRTYPNLSGVDLVLIPKSIEDNGKESTLADVQWNSSEQTNDAGDTATRYVIIANYTGTNSYQYATGYTIIANYTGEVAKTGCSVVTCTAIFGSIEAPKESTESESGSSTASAGVDLSTLKLPLLIGGRVAVLAVSGAFVFRRFKKRR